MSDKYSVEAVRRHAHFTSTCNHHVNWEVACRAVVAAVLEELRERAFDVEIGRRREQCRVTTVHALDTIAARWGIK